MTPIRLVPAALAAALAATATLPAHAQETASYAVTTDVKLTTDQRSRGVSDSFNRPGAKVSVQVAHESGLVGLAEFATVSRKQFLDGAGLGITLAGGYRFGDPEGWHYGLGLATELFPGAQFQAPHSFNMETGEPGDWRSTRYNSAFAVAEIGYGNLEARVMNVISKTYRGANTGGVCGTMLALMADPTPALECYARGDHTVPGIGDRPLKVVKSYEKTTPAGRFVTEPGRNLNGEDIFWVDYDAAVSMHRVRATNPRERRLQRLA